MSTAAPAVASRPVYARQALGWPAGSIRALLALGILLYSWVLVLVHDNGKPLLSQDSPAEMFIFCQVLLVLILAHFFLAHGKTIGRQVSAQSPLWLPRGTLRLALICAYVGLIWYLVYHEVKITVPQVSTLSTGLGIILCAFLVGHFFTSMVVRLYQGPVPSWYQDICAWVALIGMLLLAFALIVRLVINPTVSSEVQLTLKNTQVMLAAIVAFYYGARS